MTEFWESSFIKNQMMWGFEPSDSAILTKDFFLEKKVNDILIPGIGYGRNAKVFIDNGINVTGIEISKTAIDLARQNGLNIPIFHGSVTYMPFDNKLYDGIFCYALIHLLNNHERYNAVGIGILLKVILDGQRHGAAQRTVAVQVEAYSRFLNGQSLIIDVVHVGLGQDGSQRCLEVRIVVKIRIQRVFHGHRHVGLIQRR
ncbi:MAG: class I SAM-dependent methyltransferase, partial [Bacillota bacterium]|nr:class I SAM-dependent methyltransferase [Bacillota bacterium]